jgi:hypothetical protein
MNAFFQLWDITTGNLVTEFDSEDEAIEALRGIQAEDGDGALLEFALFRFQDDRPTLVAKERALVRYVARARKRRELRSVPQ